MSDGIFTLDVAEPIRNDQEDFVPTAVARQVMGTARMIVERGECIGLVHGGSGMGKTTALRAVERGVPGCIYIRADTAKARPKPMLLDIARAMHASCDIRSTAEVFDGVCRAMLGRRGLLIVDEIHKYCGLDSCFDVLRDLCDDTRMPQLWAGTTDLKAYFSGKIIRGREPLAQIQRRIVVARDLNQCEFTADDIRRMLAKGRFGLEAPAIAFLKELANLKHKGGLALVRNAYGIACDVCAAAGKSVVTLKMISQAQKFGLSDGTQDIVMERMSGRAADEEADGKPSRATA